ncbi:MAG: hypothetical protein AB7L65_10060, partial [Hyphomonadaceae bacterium]
MSSFRHPAWIAPAAVLAASPAYADAVVIAARESADGGARIEARWADGRSAAPAMEASVANGVLTLRFAEQVEADVSSLPQQAPRTVSFANVESDGRSVRVALRQDMSASVSRAENARVIALAPAGGPRSLRPVDAAPVQPAATVAIGQRQDLTRLSFRWPGPTTVAPRRNGDALELRFSRAADIDIAELSASPPRFVRSVRLVSTPSQPVRIAMTLDPGVRHRQFVDGDRVVIDLLPPLEPPAAAAPAAPAPETPPAPQQFQPPRGDASVRVDENSDATRIAVTWPSPARAAAFRRGESIWLVFEARGRINLSNIARAGRWRRDMQIVNADNAVAIRIPAPPEVLVSAQSDGATWTFTLAPRAQSANPAVAPVRRDMGLAARGRIIAEFGREGAVAWLQDPEIGDRIGVAMLTGPVMGVGQRRATLEAAVLPSAQGAVIETRADGVDARFEGGQLVVSRGLGLITTQAVDAANAAEAEDPDAAPTLDDEGL